MSWIAGLVPTGHVVEGPTSRLVDLRDPDDSRSPTLTAVDIPEAWRSPALTRATGVGRSFLQTPMVFGLAGLVDEDAAGGRYVYRTGGGRALAEILQTARGDKQPAGARAAAELAWLAGAVLVDASDAGALSGVFAHGDVGPWRLLARPEGDLIVVGYGLPEPEALALSRTAGAPTTAASAYAPPERFTGRGEDVRSDLFSLALLVAELATGAPLYDGTPAEVRGLAAKAEARKRLSSRTLPRALADALAAALAPEPEARPDPRTWVTTWAAVLGSGLAGPSLAELAGRAPSKAGPPPARGPALAPGATRAFSLDMISAASRAHSAGAAPSTARVHERAAPPPPATPRTVAEPHRVAPPAPVSEPQRVAPPAPAAEPHRVAPPAPVSEPHRVAPPAVEPRRVPPPAAPPVDAPSADAPRRVAPPPPPAADDAPEAPRRVSADEAPRRVAPPPPPPALGQGLRPADGKTKADPDR